MMGYLTPSDIGCCALVSRSFNALSQDILNWTRDGGMGQNIHAIEFSEPLYKTPIHVLQEKVKDFSLLFSDAEQDYALPMRAFINFLQYGKTEQTNGLRTWEFTTGEEKRYVMLDCAKKLCHPSMEQIEQDNPGLSQDTKAMLLVDMLGSSLNNPLDLLQGPSLAKLSNKAGHIVFCADPQKKSFSTTFKICTSRPDEGEDDINPIIITNSCNFNELTHKAEVLPPSSNFPPEFRFKSNFKSTSVKLMIKSKGADGTPN